MYYTIWPASVIYPGPCRIQSCMECLTFVLSQAKRWVQSVDKVLASGVSSPAMSLLASETHAKVGRPKVFMSPSNRKTTQNTTKHIWFRKQWPMWDLGSRSRQKSKVNWRKIHKEHYFFDTSAWTRAKGLRNIWISATLDVASWRIWA